MSRARGFTLIELLLGVAIFSIVALSLYMTFSNAIYLQRRSLKNEEVYRQARWAIDVMTRDLENMLPYSFPEKDMEPVGEPVGDNGDESGQVTEEGAAWELGLSQQDQAFVGEADRISMVVATPTGLKVVEYYAEMMEEESIHKTTVAQAYEKNRDLVITSEERETFDLLIREERPFGGAAADGTGGAIKEVLSRHVQRGSLEFSFAYKRPQEEPEIQDESALNDGGSSEVVLEWQSEWQEPYLPEGVRIQMAFTHPAAGESFPVDMKVLIPTGSWGGTSPPDGFTGNEEPTDTPQETVDADETVQ